MGKKRNSEILEYFFEGELFKFFFFFCNSQFSPYDLISIYCGLQILFVCVQWGLEQIKIPLLILNAEDDPVVPKELLVYPLQAAGE